MNKFNLFVIVWIITTTILSSLLYNMVSSVLAQGPAPNPSIPSIPGPVPFTAKSGNQTGSMGGISNMPNTTASGNMMVPPK